MLPRRSGGDQTHGLAAHPVTRTPGADIMSGRCNQDGDRSVVRPAQVRAPVEERPGRLGAALSLPSTWIALGILCLPVASDAGPASGLVTPSDVLLVVAVLLTARDVVRGERLAVLRSVPAAGFLALGTGTLLATTLATDFPDGLIGGARFVEVFVLVPLAVMAALRTRADAIVVVGALVVLAATEGALGLVQYLTGTGADIGGATVRAVGTFGAYNIGVVAALTGLGVAACLAVAMVDTGRMRWVAAGLAVFLVLPHLASLSRSAWIATMVAATVVVSRARPARLLAVVVAGGVAVAATVPPLAASGSELGLRLQSLLTANSAPDQSVIDREELWAAAAGMALDHPLTGVGPRAFPEHRDAYADLGLLGSSDISFGSDFQQVGLETPHSLYLLVASEQGLLVALVYATVLALFLMRSLVRVARRRSDASTTLALVGAGLLTYQLVSMATGDIGGPGSLLLAVCLGIGGWAAADVDLVPGGTARDGGAA